MKRDTIAVVNRSLFWLDYDMFVTDGRSNYDRVCEELLELVWETGAVANAPMLSGSVEEGAAHIPLFGEDCCVRRDGVYKDAVKLDTIGSILVVRYLLKAGAGRCSIPGCPTGI